MVRLNMVREVKEYKTRVLGLLQDNISKKIVVCVYFLLL